MGITDPSEPYFKGGLWGWVTDAWKKLIADASGHLQVDVVASGLPAGAATAGNQADMLTALQLIDNLTRALSATATDSIDVRFDGQTVDAEITQKTAADLTPGICGWSGSAWQKQPIIWGYSDVYHEAESSIDVSAGNETLTFSTVPAGEVWVILGLTAWSMQANATAVEFYTVTAEGTKRVTLKLLGVARISVSCDVPIILAEDHKLLAVFLSCVLDDDVYAQAWGYKMKIAE